MEIVNFSDYSNFRVRAHKLFLEQKSLIESVLPNAEVQHVGSTVIPNSLTKGDLDIQVRVTSEDFNSAVEALSKLYSNNAGSVQTESFRAFKNDSSDPPLGVQLTVIHSEFDIFWKIRDVLLSNDNYRLQYDSLKKEYEGKAMEDYREAKNEFFEWLMQTPEYRGIDIR